MTQHPPEKQTGKDLLCFQTGLPNWSQTLWLAFHTSRPPIGPYYSNSTFLPSKKPLSSLASICPQPLPNRVPFLPAGISSPRSPQPILSWILYMWHLRPWLSSRGERTFIPPVSSHWVAQYIKKHFIKTLTLFTSAGVSAVPPCCNHTVVSSPDPAFYCISPWSENPLEVRDWERP